MRRALLVIVLALVLFSAMAAAASAAVGGGLVQSRTAHEVSATIAVDTWHAAPYYSGYGTFKNHKDGFCDKSGSSTSAEASPDY